MAKGTYTSIASGFRRLRKYNRKGRTDLVEAEIERLSAYCLEKLSTQKFEALRQHRESCPAVPIESRYVIETVTVGKKRARLTFAPKTGRIEVKVGDSHTEEEREKFLEMAEIIRTNEEFTDNKTMRGDVGLKDGVYYCHIRTADKTEKYSVRLEPVEL